jgi:hypothetical protein
VLRARREHDTLHLHVDTLTQGWQPLTLRVVGYDGADTVHVHSPGGTTIQPLAPYSWRCSGTPLALSIGPAWSTAVAGAETSGQHRPDLRKA